MKINSDKYHNLWLDHPDLTDAYSDSEFPYIIHRL
jgi:hypothetical protein